MEVYDSEVRLYNKAFSNGNKGPKKFANTLSRVILHFGRKKEADHEILALLSVVAVRGPIVWLSCTLYRCSDWKCQPKFAYRRLQQTH